MMNYPYENLFKYAFVTIGGLVIGFIMIELILYNKRKNMEENKMGILSKKKKVKEEQVDPEAEQVKKIAELEAEIEEYNQTKKQHLKEATALRKADPKATEEGSFTFTAAETKLLILAAMNSEQYKAYQNVIDGQEIAKIVSSYAEVVNEEEGLPEGEEEGSNDTDESGLPQA